MTKADIDTKLSSLNKKITQNKTKHLLVESELNKLKTFDSGYFIGKSHIYRYFKFFSITQYLEYVSEWKSKRL